MNPLKKSFRIFTALAALTVLTSEAAIPSPVSQNGHQVVVTPFDRKVSMAKIFDVQENAGQNASEDPFSFFMEAKSFRYASDMGEDHWQTPEETDARHAGDCEDKAVWLYAQLKSHGYADTRLVVGKYRSIDRVYHVWVTYTGSNGDTFILDPALQHHPWKVGEFSGGFYVQYYSYDGKKRYCHKVLGT